ncbi:hypothetical protein SUGI_0828780 [Cryptomeria japonica]|nr:hypothetical protein SUGI_0828780 [Cryptomeria japonica]
MGTEEYIMFYTGSYNKYHRVHATLMQVEYEKALEDHINSTVAPALREKEDEFLLREVGKQWEYYKRMVRLLLNFVFFNVAKFAMIKPNPSEAAQRCFLEMVYNDVLCSNVQAAMMVQINKMREGESILDGTVLNNVVYYLLKVVKYLTLEKETIAMHCVHQSSQSGYVEMVENELLCKHETQLLKEDLDCHPLLKNDKMDDLSEMFKLFSGFGKGIQLMAKIFRHHVTRHGTSIVKHGGQMVAEAIKVNNKKEVIASEKDQFMRSVIQLHEKYLQCVEEEFMNHCLFKNALVAAF